MKNTEQLTKIEGATSLTAKHIMDLVQREQEKLADKYYQDGFKKGYDEGLANGKLTTPSNDEIKRKAVMGFMQFLVTQRNWDGARIGITRTLAENYLQSLDGGEQHTAPQTTKSEEIDEDVTTIGGLKEEYERKIKILGVQAQKAKKYGGNVASIEGQIQGIKWALSKVYKADLTKLQKWQNSIKKLCEERGRE